MPTDTTPRTPGLEEPETMRREGIHAAQMLMDTVKITGPEPVVAHFRKHVELAFADALLAAAPSGEPSEAWLREYERLKLSYTEELLARHLDRSPTRPSPEQVDATERALDEWVMGAGAAPPERGEREAVLSEAAAAMCEHCRSGAAVRSVVDRTVAGHRTERLIHYSSAGQWLGECRAAPIRALAAAPREQEADASEDHSFHRDAFEALRAEADRLIAENRGLRAQLLALDPTIPRGITEQPASSGEGECPSA